MIIYYWSYFACILLFRFFFLFIYFFQLTLTASLYFRFIYLLFMFIDSLDTHRYYFRYLLILLSFDLLPNYLTYIISLYSCVRLRTVELLCNHQRFIYLYLHNFYSTTAYNVYTEPFDPMFRCVCALGESSLRCHWIKYKI